MSAQSQVYFFNQRQQVVLLESGTAIATRRYDIVYSKELTIVKGVDNQLQFQFLNQDQKPVNLTGKTVTARILSADSKSIILQKSLGSIYPITGLMKLEVAASDLDSIDIQKSHFSLSVADTTYEYPVFVDAQGASRGVMNIVNGVMPNFSASLNVTIPSHPVVSGSPVTYQSSIISTINQSSFTIQTTFESFTGTVQLIGSALADFSLPYDITEPMPYDEYTGSDGIVIEGYHPYVRLTIVNEEAVGDITSILYR